jgi:transposase-like protein
MNPYKLRIRRQLHSSLREVAESHGMDQSEAVRRLLRQWRKSMEGVSRTEFLESATREDSTVIELDIPPHLRAGLGCKEICAIIAWGLSRPCNAPAPKLKLELEDAAHIMEDEGHGE